MAAADRLMTTTEYAELWGVHPRTVTRRAATGFWEAMKSGKYWVFSDANHAENLRRAQAAAAKIQSASAEKPAQDRAERPARKSRRTAADRVAAQAPSNVSSFRRLEPRPLAPRGRTA